MKISLLYMGKTGREVNPDLLDFEKRIRRYIPFNVVPVPAIKHTASAPADLKKSRESEKLLEYVGTRDLVILLDEKGKEMTSVEFAGYIGKTLSGTAGQLVFIIGGAHGFDDTIRHRANDILSLSRMTFPHKLARLFFTEQLYRAMTLLKNEPYHHV